MNAEKKGKAAFPSFHSEDLYGYVSPEWHPFRSQSQIDATDSEKDIEPTPKYTNEKKLSAFDKKLRRKSRVLDNRKEEQLASDGLISITDTESQCDHVITHVQGQLVSSSQVYNYSSWVHKLSMSYILSSIN